MVGKKWNGKALLLIESVQYFVFFVSYFVISTKKKCSLSTFNKNIKKKTYKV